MSVCMYVYIYIHIYIYMVPMAWASSMRRLSESGSPHRDDAAKRCVTWYLWANS